MPCSRSSCKPGALRRLPAISLVFVLVLGAVGCGGGGGSASVGGGGSALLSAADLLAFADTARARGDSATALGLYSQVASRFPASAEAADARMNTGDLCLAAGEFEAARAAYQAVVAQGASRLGDARLALGKSYVAEFESADSGTEGLVDLADPEEYLVNQLAVESFLRTADDASLPAATRATARYLLGEAYFRGQQFSLARSAMARVQLESASPVERQKAHIQAGLAWLQEGNADGAEVEFAAAGAAPVTTSGQAARGQLGSFSGPAPGSLGLTDLVITVQRAADEATASEDLNARAELGLALGLTQLRHDYPVALARLEQLVARRLPAPDGDFALLQLAQTRVAGGDRDGALRDYQTLVADYPASRFAQLAHEREAEILFAVFGEATAAGPTVDWQLLSNLTSELRLAVGELAQPSRDPRARALEMLGRLDSEGIPLPLTIALPQGLSPGTAGAPYRQELTAFGAAGAVRWTLAADSMLPPGLSLSEAGVLSGVPGVPGRWVVTVRAEAISRASSLLARSDTRPFLLTMQPLRVKTGQRLLDGVVGMAYSARLEGVGIAPIHFTPSSWSAVRADGRLEVNEGFPPGLQLASDGVISGTPARDSGGRPFLVALRVTDGAGRSVAVFFSLFVAPARQSSFSATHQTAIPGASAGLTATPALAATRLPAPAVSPRVPVGSAPPRVLTTVPVVAYQLEVTPDGRSLVIAGGFFSEYLAVVELTTRQVRQAPLPGPFVFGRFPFAMALSADGRQALIGCFHSSQSRAHLIDLQSLQPLWSLDTGGRTQAVAFTPDGHLALVRSADRLYSVDLQSGTTAAFDLTSVGDGPALAVFPDSRRVLVAGRARPLAAVVDLETGSSTTYPLPAPAAWAEVLPDGTTVVLNEYRMGSGEGLGGSRLFRLDLNSGTVLEAFCGAGASRFEVSPDGTRAVVVSDGSNELAVVDLSSMRVQRLRAPFPGLAPVLALAPDGRTALTFSGPASGVKRGWLLDLVTLESRVLEGAEATASESRRQAVFSPDGSRIFSSTVEFPVQSFIHQVEVLTNPTVPALVRTPLPAATVGLPFSHRFEVGGGEPAYSFGPPALLAPIAELSLSDQGVLSGIPQLPGLYAVEGSVTDAALTTATFTVPLLALEPNAPVTPLTLVTRKLKTALLGDPYTQNLAAAGGRAPYRFAVISGELPPGLSLSIDGRFGGRPTAVGIAAPLVEVTDAAGARASQQLSLKVARPAVFQPAAPAELPAPAICLERVSLRGDGRDDLVTGHALADRNLSLLASNADGTFGEAVGLQVPDLEHPGSAPAERVLALFRGDFNGDGRSDLLARVDPGFDESLPRVQRRQLVPLLADGAGGFSAGPPLQIPNGFVDAQTAELDGDGRAEVVVCGGLMFLPLGIPPTIYVERSLGDGTFSESQRLVTTSPLELNSYVNLADVDGDSRPDLITLVFADGVPVPAPLVSVCRGLGDGRFDLGQPARYPTVQSYSPGSRLALLAVDLDGDHRSEVCAVVNQGELLVYRSAGPAGLGSPVTYALGADVGPSVTLDLDGDGALDLAFPVPGSEEGAPGALLLCYNRGDGTFEPPVRVDLEFSPGTLAVGDFDGSGRQDLAVCDVNEPLVWILLHR